METSDCKLGSQGPNSGGRSGLHDHVASSSQGLLNILLQRERALVSPRDCTAPVFLGMIHTHTPLLPLHTVSAETSAVLAAHCFPRCRHRWADPATPCLWLPPPSSGPGSSSTITSASHCCTMSGGCRLGVRAREGGDPRVVPL